MAGMARTAFPFSAHNVESTEIGAHDDRREGDVWQQEPKLVNRQCLAAYAAYLPYNKRL